jgi:hypothetical protein
VPGSPCLLSRRRWSCSWRFRPWRRSSICDTRCEQRSPGDCRGRPGTSDSRHRRRSSPPPRARHAGEGRAAILTRAYGGWRAAAAEVGVATAKRAARATMSQINFGPDHAVRPRPARIAQDRARIAQDREEGERHRRGSGGSSEDTADRPGNARRVSSRWTRFGSRSHPNRQTPRNLDSRMNAARPPWPAALRRRHRRSENTSTQFVPSSNSWIRPVLRRRCRSSGDLRESVGEDDSRRRLDRG